MTETRSTEKGNHQQQIPTAKALSTPSELAPLHSSRIAVMVLAMHRSGSSALARILNLLGCDAPKTLMPADKYNSSGYWESNAFYEFNNSLLASAGSEWRDWQPFNRHWYETPRYAEFLVRSQEVLTAEYSDSCFFLYKDPRVCRLVPFWREAFSAVDVELRAIITVRHPIEVAQSLMKRNDIPEAEAVLLWLRHMLDAEYDSRGLNRAFVSYDQLLTNPAETMRSLQVQLSLRWPRLSDRVEAEINSFMNPKLRHHRVETDDTIPKKHLLGLQLTQAYSVFLRWAREGETNSDYQVLDEIRAEVDRLSEPLKLLVNQAREVVAQDAELAQFRAERAESEKELAQFRAERAESEKELAQFRAERAESEKELAQFRAERAESEKELAQYSIEISEKDEAIKDAHASLHGLRSALEQRSHEAEQTAEELSQTRSKADAQELELRQVCADLAETKQMLEAKLEIIEKMQNSVAAATQDLAELGKIVIDKEEALKRRNAAAHEAERQVDILRLELSHVNSEIEELGQKMLGVELFNKELLSSKSWRLTAPLRGISRRLRSTKVF